jgi:subtilisin family serine protease
MHTMRRHTLRHSSMAALLTLLSTSTLAMGGTAQAGAVAREPLRLPAMPSRLADGAACTGGSGKVVDAVPREQQDLQLARVRQFADGDGVTVAVVDTGVSLKAPTLKGRVAAVGEADDDCVGHGTFVAGLIAAATAEGSGFSGVAQQAHILAVRGTDARGRATDTTVAAGIRAAVDAGAEVVQVSPALTRNSAKLTSAVAHAAAHDVLIVAAAVPDSPQSPASAAPPRDYWPAAEQGVLSVIDLGAQGSRPRGALTPRRADLAAPGDGVVGIGPTGRGHFIGSGASLAAGYVAGTAALIRSAHPELTAGETARRLTSTAYPAGVPRLDAYGAVTTVAAPSAAPAEAADDSEPVRLPTDEAGARATQRALVMVGAGAGLLVSMAWAAVIVPRGRARGWRPARDDASTTT